MLKALQDEVAHSQSELETYRAQVGAVQRRLRRLAGSANPIAEEPVTNLLAARTLLQTLTDELATWRQRRLETASGQARKLYVALSETSPTVKDKQFAPIFELWTLGLLKTVEDEV